MHNAHVQYACILFSSGGSIHMYNHVQCNKKKLVPISVFCQRLFLVLGLSQYSQHISKIFQNYLQEFRSFEFQPSLSTAQQQDRVIVPNIPLLTTSWELSKSGWKEAIFSTATLFESFEAFVVSGDVNKYQIRQKITCFVFDCFELQNLPAHSFLWGYTDNLYEKLKTLSVFGKTLKPTFGILMTVSDLKIYFQFRCKNKLVLKCRFDEL